MDQASMRSLFQDEKQSRLRSARTAGLSIAIHGLMLGLIMIGTIHLHRTVIFQPMTKGSVSSVSMIAISRGAMAAALTQQNVTPEKNALSRPKSVHRPNVMPAKSTPASRSPEPSRPSTELAATGKSNPGVTGQGSDSQSMYPAYPTVSPSPQVRDRSLLPPTDQKIIVDVNLGADGQVQEARLVSGLGNALDQVVLDTVRGWQFHPAMLNGGPVPSSMELVFPFNRNYPTAE
jgi:TonB family protein